MTGNDGRIEVVTGSLQALKGHTRRTETRVVVGILGAEISRRKNVVWALAVAP